MDEFYKLMSDERRYQVALDVKSTLEDLRPHLDEKSYKVAETVVKMLDDLPAYRAERVIERFQSDCEPFTKIEFYGKGKGTVLFHGMWRGNAHIGIDLNFEPNTSRFGFWDRTDGAGKNSIAMELLKKMDVLDEYKAKNGSGFFVKEFNFPRDDEALIQYIQTFKRKLTDASPPER